MSEQQLRDVLARVVPEPPDSVADATPVVRTARRRRQVRVAGVTALAAVLVTGTLLGVRSIGTDDKNLFADDPTPQIADPYTTAPCPAVTEQWEIESVDDLDQVTAVRYCARSAPFSGRSVPVADGPSDALVDDVNVFAAAVRGLAPADPARCAAVDPIPTDSRLLLQLADGTSIGVSAGMCQDATLDGRRIDGADVTQAFLDTLRGQRDTHDYPSPGTDGAIDCSGTGSISPAVPGHEHLVAAAVCPADGTQQAVLDGKGLVALDDAWATASQPSVDPCPPSTDALPWVLAITDRGDTVRLDAGNCDLLNFQGSDPDVSLQLDVRVADLTG